MYIYSVISIEEGTVCVQLLCNGVFVCSFSYSFSLSLIDSLDTLLVMGNVSEFQKAYQLVISRPSFDIDVNTSVFEATIRGI